MSDTTLGAAVLVYFCHNPDEVLTLMDIEHKFGAGRYRSQTHGLITRYVDAGWISQENKMTSIRPSLTVRKAYYSAGPKLREAIKQHTG